LEDTIPLFLRAQETVMAITPVLGEQNHTSYGLKQFAMETRILTFVS
jgi:hypothetical protein